MKFELIEIADIIILKLFGNIDLHSHKMLTTVLQDIKAKNTKKIILNLFGVKILSSSSVGAILHFNNELKKSDGLFVLSSLSGISDRVFELLQMKDSFKIFENDKDAIQYFS